MRTPCRRLFRVLVASAFLLGAAPMRLRADEAGDRANADRLRQEGNWNEAYAVYRKLALDPGTSDVGAAGDLGRAVECLGRLNRIAEIDEFREAVVAAHPARWRVLHAAAQSWTSAAVSHGFIIAGEFQRGHHRGGGRMADAGERDRVRAMQLLAQALPLLEREPDRAATGPCYLAFARLLTHRRDGTEAWRLQVLTDIETLPDVDEAEHFGFRGRGFMPGGGQTQGAPVDAAGNPVFYRLPADFAAAASDGERWRWLLMQAMETSPALLNTVRLELARFLHGQFGVQTMSGQAGLFRGRGPDDPDAAAGIFSVHTLGEGETLAQLATGIKRFDLPDEFNFIRIFQQIAAEPDTGHADTALATLAAIFENRQQYERAAGYWREVIRRYGESDHRRERLEQIVGNWGEFDPARPQPKERGAEVGYRFRNGRRVRFEAHAIRIPELLRDVKDYLKSNPTQMDHNQIGIGNIGYRLVVEGDTKYLGEKVADWHLDLEPPKGHFDRRLTVTTPLQKPGAYLLVATMQDGNVSRIVLWVADMAMLKKPLDGQAWWFVGDAVTGAPVAKANVEFFGFHYEHLDRRRPVSGRTFNILTTQFAEFTDADGQIMLDAKRMPSDHQWLAIATAPPERLAFIGFTGVWYNRRHDQEYNETKVLCITDRPVYRPGHTVKFTAWVRHAKYDEEDTSRFAGQTFTVQINDPRGEKVFEQQLKANAYGGVAGEFELPKDATLGVYQLYLPNHGGGQFRVEEYKKPEFEVTVDAPSEPVMLGDTLAATVRATYYFGAPVTEATVSVKVLRHTHTATWYPPAPWDWFYDPGYWWFAYDYDWYPGWHAWGLPRPRLWWIPWSPAPPELVMQQELPIGADGTVALSIDTRLAKELHGNNDHRYEITAEVVDLSRRTIVGSGQVLLAREPFQVNVWADRGYYNVGDTIGAHVVTRTLAGKPVAGKGVMRLLRIAYAADGTPSETPVQTWDVTLGETGAAMIQAKASEPGQYRLACRVTDAGGRTLEGGHIFCIRGRGFDGGEFRFNDIELVPEKREYAPGETVRLMINTNRRGGTVLLFVRPANGMYLPPTVIRMTGKSAVHEIVVTKRDMPNFFIEAVTVSDGRVHSDTREIAVPPETRVVDVEIVPSAESYKPGAEAHVTVKVADHAGKPFAGALVLTMYDRALDAIAGGSNVPEIRSFFWKWRRHHSAHQETNLDGVSTNLLKRDERSLRNLGVFGHLVADRELAEGGMNAMKAGGGALRARGMAFGAVAEMQAHPPAPVMMLARAAAVGEDAMMAMDAAPAGGEAPEAALQQPMVRSAFADTAFWNAALETDADGTATVTLTMPENLTGWKIKTWAMGHGTKVGEAETTVVTAKDLMLRLQAPRFFVEKDEVVLSANIHNYLKTDKTVQAVLEFEGETLALLDADTVRQRVVVPANGERRVDWRVRVAREGEAVVRMKALTDEESDAMEMRFPVYVHGMAKLIPACGSLRPEDSTATVTLEVPAQRRVAETRLDIRYSPTLAGAMVDALPYLVDYAYGCTEQTLNRFLPTVITQKILLDMGLELKSIRDKITNLNAQELGDPATRAAQWQRLARNPVFDEETVRDMVREGLQRLTAMQVGDGGWGWFSGWGERSYPHTTATVVHGLQIARDNDVALVPGVLERGVEWLSRYQAEQVQLLANAEQEKKPYKTRAGHLDAFVYMVLVDAGQDNPAMRDYLYRDRTELAVYAKAMLGLALQRTGQTEKLAMIMRNIEQYLVLDDANQTAWLNLGNDGYWWHWYGSEYEAHAYYLKLLARTDPKGTVAPRLVKYLLNNRKHATYWKSTRDTAICLEAFADFIRASGEDKPDLTVEVLVNGRKHKEVKIDASNLFTFDGTVMLEGAAIASGPLTVEFRKTGRGPLYFNVYLETFTLEDFITRAGLEIQVDRRVYRLERVEATAAVAGARGQAVDQRVEKYKRVPLDNLALLKSGDLVEIELEIESKNDYEYLVFEDMKAAGFEPVAVRSGYDGNDMGAYVELRDERVGFFIRQLARGRHSVAYRMRAEIPGIFSALPARGYAMYAPELRANSDEITLRIED